MKCDKAQEFFSDYIESTLDRPMTVALEAHLNGCELCSADVASLRSMWTVLDKVPQVEPPADFVADNDAPAERVPQPPGGPAGSPAAVVETDHSGADAELRCDRRPAGHWTVGADCALASGNYFYVGHYQRE
jgi:hypothetical protein